MKTTKPCTLAFILLLAASSMLSTSAQSIPKPAVPEFIIETVISPYDVAPTTITTIDPYTGKETVTTQPGYHVENKTTLLKIKNQPFSSFDIQENNQSWTINLFYDIRFKGHYTEDWRYYRLYNGSSDGNLRQGSSSGYTVVVLDSYLPQEGKMDFQVEALIGYEHGVCLPFSTPRVIEGKTSGWSQIQTAEIKDSKVIATPTFPPCTQPPITQTPTEPASPTQAPIETPAQAIAQNTIDLGLSWEQIIIVAMAVAIAVLAVGLIVLKRRQYGK